MSIENEIQSLINSCDEALDNGNFELVDAKAAEFSQIVGDHKLILSYGEHLASILEKIGRYDEALSFITKYAEIYKNSYFYTIKSKTIKPSQEDRRLYGHFTDRIDDKISRLRSKIKHQADYGYCGKHERKLWDGVCPSSKERIIDTQHNLPYIHKWSAQGEVNCFPINELAIIPQFQKLEIFSKKVWKIQFRLRSILKRIYDLKFELESCKHLKFIEGFASSKEQGFAYPLIMNEDALKSKNEEVDWAVYSLEKDKDCIVDLTFLAETKSQVEEKCEFEYLITVKYWVKDEKKDKQDVCVPITLIIYPSLEIVFNTLFNYFKNVIGQPQPFALAKKMVEKRFKFNLNEDTLRMILDLMRERGVIEYEVGRKKVEVVFDFPTGKTKTEVELEDDEFIILKIPDSEIEFEFEKDTEVEEEVVVEKQHPLEVSKKKSVKKVRVASATTTGIEEKIFEELTSFKEEFKAKVDKLTIMEKLQFYIDKPKDLKGYLEKIFKSNWDQTKKDLYQEVIIDILNDFIDDKWYKKLGKAVAGIAGKVLSDSLVDLAQWGFGKLADYLQEKIP